jgi:hypothetical protein
MLRSVTLVRTDVSEELSAPFIRVTRIGELGITLAVSSNRLNDPFNRISQQLHMDMNSRRLSGTQLLVI